MENALLVKDVAGQTMLHPVGLIAVIVLGVAVLALPRRWAVLPMIVMACFIAPTQRIVIATLDFDLLRIMVVFGWVRLLVRGEARGLAWKPIDTAVVCWSLAGAAAYTILYGTTSAFVNRLGAMFDAAGMYFMFRLLVTDWRDLERVIMGFIVISVPVAIAFTYEQLTRHNIFSVFGGVPATTIARQGRLRCQGAFAHPIMAGCFFASLMPLFAARWWAGGAARKAAIVGLLAAGTTVVMTASSTPVMAVLFGMFGGAMFLVRDKLRIIRWGTVLLLLILHFVRDKPVWHLISRINVVGGSTGWHRYHLMDEAIKRFDEWCLCGVESTGHWGMGLLDVTNQYILEGVRGGILTLVLFVLILVLAFRGIGQRLRLVTQTPAHIALVWAIGVSLFVHCASFISVSYFGQIKLLWYLTLAIIGSITPTATLVQATLRPRGSVLHQPSAPLVMAEPSSRSQEST